MTCSRGAAAANSSSSTLRERPDDHRVDPALEIARDVGHRLALAERRRPAAARSTSPPSSRTAISKVVRVRSDAFSNSIATCRPSSALAVGASRPSARSAFSCAAELEAALEIGGVEVEDRQKVLAARA